MLTNDATGTGYTSTVCEKGSDEQPNSVTLSVIVLLPGVFQTTLYGLSPGLEVEGVPPLYDQLNKALEVPVPV